MITIKGLSKAAVLAALYNAARPLGMGFMHYDPTPMVEAEAQKYLAAGTYFDYLKGRVMKVDLAKDDAFDEQWYDRDNGVLTAHDVIEALRRTGETNNKVTQVIHKCGTVDSIADAECRLEADHGYSESGMVHLGLADYAEHLKPKVEEAKKKLK